VYGRLDFTGKVPEDAFEVVVNLESWANQATQPRRALRLGALVDSGRILSWKVADREDKLLADSIDSEQTNSLSADSVIARVALQRNFEFRLPLCWLLSTSLDNENRGPQNADQVTSRLRLRFSLWQSHLPVDALPVEGWIELDLLAEEDLLSVGG
jgi:hypothetical protein